MTIRKSITEHAILSELFSYKDGTFTAFASDLNGHELMRQLYDDACDVGFGIKSARTRSVVTFHLAEVKRNADNDIQFWEYHPTPDNVRTALSSLKNLKVIIFNT